MSGTEIRKEVERFECPRLKGIAMVTHRYASLSLGGGPLEERRLEPSRCSRCDDCGIGSPSTSGRAFTYDWASCAHPLVRKTPTV